MTVGELIYEQALEQGYNPTYIEGLISPMNRTMDSYRTVIEKMAEPLKVVNSVVESMRPHIEVLNRISIPAISKLAQYNEDEENSLIPAFVKPVQDVRIINIEEITNASPKQGVEFTPVSYSLPKNASWEFLEIKFIDGHFVKVSYPNMKSKKFDYKDMGFANMKTTRPDRKWALLQSIAESDGTLTKKTWDERFHRNIKYELNEGLKKFFGMETNPISHYTKERGYQSLFSIQSDK